MEIEIYNLEVSRLLRSDKEISIFEETIEKIMSLEDSSYISELCKGFDDNTEHHEVMFGLVHAIESFNDESYIKELFRAIPNMIPHAKDWLKILHYRLLNSDNCRNIYSKKLGKIDNNLKKISLSILKEIKNEDTKQFNDKVEEIEKML